MKPLAPWASPAPREGARDGFSRLDWLLAGLMTVLAAVVRARALQLVPTLTDETDDMLFALRIAQGGFWPAVSHDTYNGPLNHYLLALGLWAGVGPAWPRLLSLLLGALTVGLTYLLGVSLAGQMTKDEGRRTKERRIHAGTRRDTQGEKTEDKETGLQSSIFNLQSLVFHLPSSILRRPSSVRLAGLVAAALMAVAFVPVVVNSHIAWSNATTPFWTTLALLALSEAVRREQPRLLVLAGGLAGLAAQTHPTASLYLLGGALWFAVTRPAWLRTRWTWLALLAAILVVGNLIGYNLVTGGGSAEQLARREYASTSGQDLADYVANVRGFLGLAYQLVGSTFLSTLSAQAGPPAMRSPLVVAYAVVALAALVYAAWRRASLPLILWLTALVLLPVVIRAYDSHISARYMAPLLPPTFAAVGVWLGPRLAGLVAPGPRLSRDRWLGLAALVLTVALVVYPLRRLDEFLFYELRDGRNNARLWQIAALVAAPGRQGTPVWLDRGLRDARLDAGGHVYKALGTLLDLEGVPHDNPWVEELPTAAVGSLLVLTDARRDALAPLLRLEPVSADAPPAPAAPGGYWVYRVVGR